MTDLLAEIRARDALKGHSPAGAAMTLTEADRRNLIRLLDRALIRTPITALGLDRRPLNLLRAAGIHTVAHLARLTEDELEAVRNMGAVSIRNIKARLFEEFGLTLGQAGEPGGGSLPVYAWGESVTWAAGRILVPLCRGEDTVADLELDQDGAEVLAAMLADVAEPERTAP